MISKRKIFMRGACRLILLTLLLAAIRPASDAWTQGVVQQPYRLALRSEIGPRDGVVLAAADGRILFTHNADRKLVPASVLKILTVLAARYYLGAGYRYVTEFYRDDRNRLVIKGYGDPLLISEVLFDMAARVAADWPHPSAPDGIVLDNTFFEEPLDIPGVTRANQPYNAPNGALGANFNTVFFKRSLSGQIVTAEPQTPLVPVAVATIRQSGLEQGRIVLSPGDQRIPLYAGQLMAHFLATAGLPTVDPMVVGRVHRDRAQLFLRLESPFDLDAVSVRLLQYSNNYIANQLLITMGTALYGPPGNLDKGVKALGAYALDRLGLTAISLTEGSGISRRNRLSAGDMLTILRAFEPHHRLLPFRDRMYVKTGTLAGIGTRAGYWVTADGQLCPVVVLINTPGKSIRRVMQKVVEFMRGWEMGK